VEREELSIKKPPREGTDPDVDLFDRDNSPCPFEGKKATNERVWEQQEKVEAETRATRATTGTGGRSSGPFAVYAFGNHDRTRKRRGEDPRTAASQPPPGFLQGAEGICCARG
jgi:hypothetical protein